MQSQNGGGQKVKMGLVAAGERVKRTNWRNCIYNEFIFSVTFAKLNGDQPI